MKKILITFATVFASLLGLAQNLDKIINPTEALRIEKILSADDMQGRKTFTPAIDKAAHFIAGEFANNHLNFWGNDSTYFQNFEMVTATPIALQGLLDKDSLNIYNVVAHTTAAQINITSLSNYPIVTVKKEDDFYKKIYPFFQTENNVIILIDTSFAQQFKNLQHYTYSAKFTSAASQIFILTGNTNPSSINLQIQNKLLIQPLKNVIGVLPGKSKKSEYVIFSAHYDHLGIGRPNANKDSIYNGANDDAAGTTAVIMLSKYFSAQKIKNERTLIFVAFTAEEIGGYGSRYFSKQLNADSVVAMFNIEMIGTPSKWGINSAYLTGYEKSNMGQILQNNLTGSAFHFEPDPYPGQNLFYRSDNATLAAVGVPAHTISTSKMDSEPYYHTVGDEIQTLDMQNMAQIIKAIALSSTTIVNGKDTPTRVQIRQN